MFPFLSKIHPACHSDTKRIKAGSNSKMTDKHAVGCSILSCLFGPNLICLRCINCPCNNIAKSISLLDKIAIFICIG